MNLSFATSQVGRGRREWREVRREGIGDGRERDNGKKQGGRERWEDDMRERDEARRGGSRHFPGCLFMTLSRLPPPPPPLSPPHTHAHTR